jgi:Lar family restriction alleviation protein
MMTNIEALHRLLDGKKVRRVIWDSAHDHLVLVNGRVLSQCGLLYDMDYILQTNDDWELYTDDFNTMREVILHISTGKSVMFDEWVLHMHADGTILDQHGNKWGLEEVSASDFSKCAEVRSMSELLTCPFCGQDSILIEKYDEDWSYIICRDCHGRTGYHISNPNAVTAWNRRVNK